MTRNYAKKKVNPMLLAKENTLLAHIFATKRANRMNSHTKNMEQQFGFILLTRGTLIFALLFLVRALPLGKRVGALSTNKKKRSHRFDG